MPSSGRVASASLNLDHSRRCSNAVKLIGSQYESLWICDVGDTDVGADADDDIDDDDEDTYLSAGHDEGKRKTGWAF